MAIVSRIALAAAFLAAPAAGYVMPPQAERAVSQPVAQQPATLAESAPVEEASFGAFGVAAASACVGAVAGWLSSSRKNVAGAAAASAVALAQAPAAVAEVDYANLQYLGGSDKVDINNANVQAYRQFPGMYPTAAGFIATHGPYKEVSDIFKEPGLDDKLAAIIKKYEKNLVCFEANPAYFIDRINNAMYR